MGAGGEAGGCEARLSRFLAASRWEDLAEAVRREARRALLNIARMGRFSADRSIESYAENIWRVGTVGGP